MKRVAAGVVCLTAVTLGGAYAAPLVKPHHQAEAALGSAMTDSIHDAIQSAVAKIHDKHHPASSKPQSSALSVDQQVERSSLRGKSAKATNPWEPVKPLRIMDNDLTPVAPMDRLTPGIEAQTGGLMPPGYWPRAVYYKKDDKIVNSFPKEYSVPAPEPPQNFLVCKTSPDEWVDKQGFNCQYYETALWCTKDGKLGPKWKKSFGTFQSFSINNVGANQACCQCGGGARMSVVGGGSGTPLQDRHLLAPPDRLPDPSARWFESNNGYFDVPARPLRPNQAPEDYVPLPINQVAPLDTVEMKYARYLHELHDQTGKANPRGFSVRYYNVPPPSCGPEIASQASAIDLALNYQGSASAALLAVNTSVEYSPVGLDAKSLRWPTKKVPVGGLFWAKWSGTLVVLEQGKYDFDLDLGFNSESWLKVDGMRILTDGQCKISKDKGTCAAKGCKWSKADGSCAAKGEALPKQAKTPGCKKGTYRASPILFGDKPKAGEVDVVINPASATTVLTVPTGVKDFMITIHSDMGADLQIQDKASKTDVVKFNGGIVNNQQREGTYHGMTVSFTGDNPASEGAKLQGVTTSDMEVTLMSYSPNPATVKVTYSHGGLKGAKEPKGCEKIKAADAKKMVVKWSEKLQQRYEICLHAWAAVKQAYPGGFVSWNQWEGVWSLAWGQETAAGEAGGNEAWQMGFATIDADADGHVSEAEFLKGCSMGGPAGAGPSPAPAPALKKAPPAGKNQDVKLDFCLTVKVMDKASWPKDAFKDTGFKDHEVLGQLIGSPVTVKENKPKGVMLASPDGKADWFYPKGTFYCVQATQGGRSPSGRVPAEYVSSRGPAPSIANIVPQIIGGVPAPAGKHTLAPRAPAAAGPAAAGALLQRSSVDIEHDLPAPALDNSIELGAGGHCIEAMVMVTPSARNLALKYKGPDTREETVVVPGQLMHCDPVIPACATPLRDQCMAYKNQKCPAAGPGPAPAPAGASPAPAAAI